MRKTLIHVNQHVIKSNRLNQNGPLNPPLTVKDYKSNRKGDVAILKLKGQEVGRFVYNPDKPLSCGAHVWFQTNVLEVEVL